MKTRLIAAALFALALAAGTTRIVAADSGLLCALCSIYSPGDIYYTLYGCAFLTCPPLAAARK